MYDLQDSFYKINYLEMTTENGKHFYDFENIGPWAKNPETKRQLKTSSLKKHKTFYKISTEKNFETKKQADRKAVSQRMFYFGHNNEFQPNSFYSEKRQRSKMLHFRNPVKREASQYSVNSTFECDQIAIPHQKRFPTNIYNKKMIKNKIKGIQNAKINSQKCMVSNVRNLANKLGQISNKTQESKQILLANSTKPHKASLSPPLQLERKKSKVGCLGYQKFSRIRSMIKHNSSSIEQIEKKFSQISLK